MSNKPIAGETYDDHSSAQLFKLELPMERAEFHMERAKRLLIVGSGKSLELERIIKEVFKAFAFVPDDPKYFLFLAKVFRAGLDLSGAMNCYRYVLSLEPDNKRAKANLAELLTVKGKEVMIEAEWYPTELAYRKAKAMFEESLVLRRDVQPVQLLKAVCQVHCNELTEALETINKVMKLAVKGPPPVEAFILRAKILWAKGVVEEGNADLRKASAMDPDHPEVVAFAARSYAKAETLYRLCVEDFTAGHLDFALMHVKHALYITSDDVKLHIMIAKIYRLQGALNDAYLSICKASEIFEKINASSRESNYNIPLPSDIMRQTNLILNEIAMQHGQEGDYKRAILLFNKIIKNELQLVQNYSGEFAVKMDYSYYLNRGDCYRGLNSLHEAIDDYNAALEVIGPASSAHQDVRNRLSISHYHLAVGQYNSSDFPAAERELDQAILHNGTVPTYFALRGQARYYNSNFREACMDYKRTLVLDPANEEVRQKLSQFEDLFDASDNYTKNANKIFTCDTRNLGYRGVPVHEELKERRTDNSLYIQKGVVPLVVTPEDNIDMMLNPHEARSMPVLKMLDIPRFPRGKIKLPEHTGTGVSGEFYPRGGIGKGKSMALPMPSVPQNRESSRPVSRSSLPPIPGAEPHHDDEAVVETNNDTGTHSDMSFTGEASVATNDLMNSTLGPLYNSPDFTTTVYACDHLKSKNRDLRKKQHTKLDVERNKLHPLLGTAKSLAFERAHPNGYATGEPVKSRTGKGSRATSSSMSASGFSSSGSVMSGDGSLSVDLSSSNTTLKKMDEKQLMEILSDSLRRMEWREHHRIAKEREAAEEERRKLAAIERLKRERVKSRTSNHRTLKKTKKTKNKNKGDSVESIDQPDSLTIEPAVTVRTDKSNKDILWDPEEHRRQQLIGEAVKPTSQFVLDMVPSIEASFSGSLSFSRGR